jgi:hypothetical protein
MRYSIVLWETSYTILMWQGIIVALEQIIPFREEHNILLCDH